MLTERGPLTGPPFSQMSGLSCNNLGKVGRNVAPVNDRLSDLRNLGVGITDSRGINDKVRRHRILTRNPIKKGVSGGLRGVKTNRPVVPRLPTCVGNLELQAIGAALELTSAVAKGNPLKRLRYRIDDDGNWLSKHGV